MFQFFIFFNSFFQFFFFIIFQGQHNDARTNLAIALTAAEEGAAIANHTEMIQVLYDEHDGKANGVRVRDHMTSDEYDIHAKSIIFAGGPFTDSMRLLENKDSKPAVNGAAGTHIVLPGYYSPPDIGMLDINTSDGRFLFFLPWQGSVLVGTTDRKGPPVSVLFVVVWGKSFLFFCVSAKLRL